ncbi:universal stress protein, partial [Microvirga sp. 0TCS3.31]
MKSILVPVEEHVLMHSVLESALQLGRTLDAYLEGMAITPNMPPYIASDIAIGDLSFLDPQVRRERATASRRRFETFMAAQRVPQFDAEPTSLSFGWRGEDLAEDDFVGHYARTFDITVLGRPSDQANEPRPPTVEAALFESGRPVLL